MPWLAHVICPSAQLCCVSKSVSELCQTLPSRYCSEKPSAKLTLKSRRRQERSPEKASDDEDAIARALSNAFEDPRRSTPERELVTRRSVYEATAASVRLATPSLR